jgi:adenine-specific DNA-methyltransferase
MLTSHSRLPGKDRSLAHKTKTTPADGAALTLDYHYDEVRKNLSGAGKVAAWFLDSDYDGRTFCITQAFFPDASAWEKLAKALKGAVDEERFAAFSGTVSLPFKPGKYACAAVKVIAQRGNEVMRVVRLKGKY